MNAAIETRLQVQLFLLRTVALLVAALFTWGAIAVPRWSWLLAVPLEAVALVLLQRGARERRASGGERGIGPSVAGALLVVATVPVTFAVGNLQG
ncbi:hypothetical protein GCM10023258_33850 [Terrabacter aeriphilus]|uniref:Uncharacterized protein n=1 Tax=Terrabacter aeriphilus TaxID=515662 RepID=A0ABP9JJM5_9MICO